MRAGLALRADEVISLAGFVTPGPAEQDDPFHIQQGFAEFFGDDVHAYDLRDALKAQPETRLVQIIGGDYAPDVARAKALAGVGNARVEIIPGVAMHHVALPAIADGTLRRLLQEAFA